MKTINANKPLPEVQRRIKALLPHITESVIKVDRIIINDKHRIHFHIANNQYILVGDIYEIIKEPLRVVDR